MKTIIFTITLVLILTGCSTQSDLISREESLINIEKFDLQDDLYPPKLHSNEFTVPKPLKGLINTAGAEDSPFIPINSDYFYFFFTPDASIPAEGQVGDKVTGIYVSKKVDNEWTKPTRVVLQNSNKLSLDGCEFVLDNKIWFCSAREGYTGLHWFTAEKKNDHYKKWKLADFPSDYKIGELHIHNDTLYFHSDMNGTAGQNDIWSLELIHNEWQNLANLKTVNSDLDDSLPYITNDGQELWLTRFYQGSPALFRSKLTDNSWSNPELIISQFAGEPTLDNQGNLYFVHHYVIDGKIQEADIYHSKRK
ncbi:membrane lipoprotein lipid attachment site-containing protein [Candidatus Falkowbacteria bacterium]|jgi:hypothetical protein|nr:membrane lipoprotein lipid attachment site-containing protein [Candidatus Falkowbacteria bacterium]MBT7007558.1 membrane lipoprotein lipid attachment site-containing protein [Candidatus Falkowbacteria bacterium]